MKFKSDPAQPLLWGCTPQPLIHMEGVQWDLVTYLGCSSQHAESNVVMPMQLTCPCNHRANRP